MYATFVWMLILVNYFRETYAGYVEIVEEKGCESCRLLLTCRHLTAVIAILNVDFVPKINNELIDDSNITSSTLFPPVHPRDVLNQRCSGVNHCSFILAEDCPGSEYYGRGNITVKYACITEDRIWKYCNTDLVLPKGYMKGISEGFIHNPGYPRFYAGQKRCRWKIAAHPPQKIRLTILDISFTVDRLESPDDCTDLLEIKDSGQVIHSTCRQEHPPTEIISGSESVEIVLSSKDILNPRRGFLVHYTVIGCLQFAVPQNAYLVFSREDLVVVNCCVGYHFSDTGTRTKTVRCFGALWNISLPLLKCEKDKSTPHPDHLQPKTAKDKATSIMATELIAPITIIFSLFAINGVVLYFIHKARRKQALQLDDEELGTFTTSPVDS